LPGKNKRGGKIINENSKVLRGAGMNEKKEPMPHETSQLEAGKNCRHFLQIVVCQRN